MAGDQRQQFVRAGLLAAVSTVIITTSIVGVLAIARGNARGTAGLLPWYVLVGALCFLAAMIILEQHDSSGRMILATASLVGVVGFVSTTLSVEGVRFLLANPDRAFASELLLYILAAALISTGIGYWTIRHWRDVIGTGAAE